MYNYVHVDVDTYMYVLILTCMYRCRLSLLLLQVDVFAYGMILYELITLQVPFNNFNPQKRNHAVRDGKRPPIGAVVRFPFFLISFIMLLTCYRRGTLLCSCKS